MVDPERIVSLLQAPPLPGLPNKAASQLAYASLICLNPWAAASTSASASASAAAPTPASALAPATAAAASAPAPVAGGAQAAAGAAADAAAAPPPPPSTAPADAAAGRSAAPDAAAAAAEAPAVEEEHQRLASPGQWLPWPPIVDVPLEAEALQGGGEQAGSDYPLTKAGASLPANLTVRIICSISLLDFSAQFLCSISLFAPRTLRWPGASSLQSPAAS